MVEVRWAKEGEVARQKELWKLCFGDPQSYIDFYFANRYRKEETLVLLHKEQIIAMLTLIPVRTVFADNQSFATSMLYAVGTHPEYQHEGFGTQLMDLCHKYQTENGIEYSILVPAEQKIVDFYHNQGYQGNFYLREFLLSGNMINSLKASNVKICTMLPIEAQEYNARRNEQLKGKFHIAYGDKDIEYQKKLSQQSGADIYSINIETTNGCQVNGCMVLERRSLDKVVIKELLISEEFLHPVIKEIVKLVPSKEYLLRTPVYAGENLGGVIRSFGMIKDHRKFGPEITSEDEGYLGIAFD